MINEIMELTKTDLLSSPCWLIGINMTPWDVHKNCSPIDGKIILNKHTDGSFLSLKNFNAITRNERNTYVIKGMIMLLASFKLPLRVLGESILMYLSEMLLIKAVGWE